ncbi:MAG: class I SAM-dependent methyltransferase [Planctomycetes bacterium]|nr:class I SAM-dependent methyltransferase [Planctomycetota bacterium]
MWLSPCDPTITKYKPSYGGILADLADYEWLTGPEAARWLEELSLSTEPVHQQLAKLRKTLVVEHARQIVQQVELRRRAVVKFGDLAAKMFFSDIPLQQATDLTTARYKASRIPRATPVVDYCCGIGGDLLAFAERGQVTGWDHAPELVHFANANLQAVQLHTTNKVSVGEVESQTPDTGEIWHVDPDRRVEGRRSTQIEWHSPGPELIDRWLATNPNGLLKLAPATVVPEAWAREGEREWITHNRQCRQQITWFGELASAGGQHRATTLQKNKNNTPIATSFVGSPEVAAPRTTQISRYIYDTDPALRAAHLTGAMAVDQGLYALQSGASYLTSDRAVEHPLLSCFEVLDQLPLRLALLSKHLRSKNIGQLEIKKRGVDTDPERLRKQLKLSGDETATLLLTKIGKSEIALLAKRFEG